MMKEPTVTKSERAARAEAVAREMLDRGETPTVRAVYAICGGDYTAVHRVVADIKREHQAARARDSLGAEAPDDYGDLPELVQRVAAANPSPAVQRLGLHVMASTQKIAAEAISHGIAAVRAEMDGLLRAKEIDLQSVQQQLAREQADHAETASLVSGLYEAREVQEAERDALAIRVTEAEALLAERDDRIVKLEALTSQLETTLSATQRSCDDASTANGMLATRLTEAEAMLAERHSRIVELEAALTAMALARDEAMAAYAATQAQVERLEDRVRSHAADALALRRSLERRRARKVEPVSDRRPVGR